MPQEVFHFFLLTGYSPAAMDMFKNIDNERIENKKSIFLYLHNFCATCCKSEVA